MRRFLISCAVVAVALLAQLTFINRLALPGGAGPDLVLLAVVALALTGGPLAGLLTGFLAGLALDVAPPASHTIGQYALVFCVVGYACGRLAALGEASPALYVGISAAAAAVGAALHAALGVMLSDPEVTWAAVRHVLPPSLIYDVILSPFVLYAVVRLNGWARRTAPGESASAASASARWMTGAAGLSGVAAGTVRQASSSGTPRLHLGDRRGSEAWLSAVARTPGAARPGVQWRPGGQREPRLRPTGSASTRVTGVKVPIPKVRFTLRRRHSLAGRGTGGTARAAVPHFSRRSVTGTIGTGGTLSRTTPRRGTFGGRRSLGRRSPIGADSAKAGFSSRRGPFGHGPTGRSMLGKRALRRARRGSPGRGSFGGTSAGQRSFGAKSPGRGSFSGSGSFSGRRSGAYPGGGLPSGRGSIGRRPAPRLRMHRGSVRVRVLARVLRFLDWGRGGYR
jgi:rod shape-determining protein MreD